MRRLFVLVGVAFLTGCSNAPIAGFLDCIAPARGGPPTGGSAPILPDVRPPGPQPDVLPPPIETVPPVGPRG